MDAMTKAALKVMLKDHGLMGGLRLAFLVGWNKAKGHPFSYLPPPEDSREKGSRDQLGPAVLLYRILSKSYPMREALGYTRRIVEASGRAFLSELLSGLDIPSLLKHPERENLLRAYLEPLPNAIFQLEFHEQELHFTVLRCRFVSLCHQLGHPELAPLFCAVDDAFFSLDLPDVHLTRPFTLATGGDHCPFILSIGKEETHKS